MEIIALAPGDRTPEAADWISVEALPDSRYNVAGCIEGEQEIVFAAEPFASFEEAKLAGIFWARHRGATTLYIETAS